MRLHQQTEWEALGLMCELSKEAKARIGNGTVKMAGDDANYKSMKDEDFFNFFAGILNHAQKRILRIQEDRGIKGRARRKANPISLRDGVVQLLKKHGRLNVKQIADLMISELNFDTESTGERWKRSVYQGGIVPLLKSFKIKKDSDRHYFVD